MINASVPCIDYSKVESNHQVSKPKRKGKDGHLKKARTLSRKEILQQLVEATHPFYWQ